MKTIYTDKFTINTDFLEDMRLDARRLCLHTKHNCHFIHSPTNFFTGESDEFSLKKNKWAVTLLCDLRFFLSCEAGSPYADWQGNFNIDVHKMRIADQIEDET